jgi:hypothetical protein
MNIITYQKANDLQNKINNIKSIIYSLENKKNSPQFSHDGNIKFFRIFFENFQQIEIDAEYCTFEMPTIDFLKKKLEEFEKQFAAL